MQTNPKPLIQLEDVGKTFAMRGGDVHALKGIDLEIQPRDFISIVGTSGSGKSTLLYILGMLIEPTKGTYRFHEDDVARMDDHERSQVRGREIGFVFQSFHLVPQLDVIRNVMLASRYVPGLSRSASRKRAIELIDRVGLGHRRGHRPVELSNGEMQRVAIARALLTEPSVLLADEPTGNLDEENREQIFDLLATLNKDGVTIALVTHDMQLAARTPKLLRLRNGEVLHEAA
ncbi:MAG: ABC transporter ATP-binding protein [Planctomycetota bacterium]